MTELHTRKKIEVIMDKLHVERVVALFENHDVLGHTVIPSVSGKGSRGRWTPDRLTAADDRVLVIAVMSEATADAILADLGPLFEEIPGVAFVSEVQVLRPHRF
ncbi:MAG: P-II family nitrogen regulator [Myxococcota bacterium]